MFSGSMEQRIYVCQSLKHGGKRWNGGKEWWSLVQKFKKHLESLIIVNFDESNMPILNGFSFLRSYKRFCLFTRYRNCLNNLFSIVWFIFNYYLDFFFFIFQLVTKTGMDIMTYLNLNNKNKKSKNIQNQKFKMCTTYSCKQLQRSRKNKRRNSQTGSNNSKYFLDVKQYIHMTFDTVYVNITQMNVVQIKNQW